MGADPMPTAAAWSLLLAAASARREGRLPPAPGAWRLSSAGALEPASADDARAILRRRDDGTFVAGPALDPEARDFVELYLPLLGGADGDSFVLAHLGQSADAAIASEAGANDVVTGEADFVHMHRLRALSDAVLVGAGTVAADDPRLTVRLVEGPDPVRVVLDPESRLGDGHGVFTDGLAPTLRVRSTGVARRDRDRRVGPGGGTTGGGGNAVDVVTLPSGGSGLALDVLLATLRERGLRIVFVEGGGVTVTRWLEAGLLDRLHLVAAPLLLGAARPALRLRAARSADEALRPPTGLYQLGRDVLWDFDLRGERDGTGDEARRRDAAEGTFRRLA